MILFLLKSTNKPILGWPKLIFNNLVAHTFYMQLLPNISKGCRAFRRNTCHMYKCCTCMYHIRQNFRWLKFRQRLIQCIGTKISPNLILPIARVTMYLPGSCGLSSWVAMCICECAHDRTNVPKFSLCKKNLRKKISPTACIGKIGENFLLAKISTYMYVYIIMTLYVANDFLKITCTYTLYVHVADQPYWKTDWDKWGSFWWETEDISCLWCSLTRGMKQY